MLIFSLIYSIRFTTEELLEDNTRQVRVPIHFSINWCLVFCVLQVNQTFIEGANKISEHFGLCFEGYQGMGGSPAKHVTVVQQPPLQIQPPILSQPGQQQYVPVSVVEPTGRQMLLTVSLNFFNFYI